MKAILFTALSALCVQAFAGENWPQFRGAAAAGFSTNIHLPDKWSTTENVAWKTDLPGRSWSSPIVWGDRVFLTAVVNQGEAEAPKKGLYFGGERPLTKSEHHWKVLCLDLATGKVQWEKTVHRGLPQMPIHLKSSYGAETPVTDGERIYALFGNIGVFAFTLEGKEVWSKRLQPRKMRYGWGTAASPVLHGGRLFIVSDNDEQAELFALEAKTGQELWRADRDEKSNWATPFIWENAQRTELITSGSRAVRSYDLDGKPHWSFRGMSSIAIPTPFAGDGLLFVSSGYVGDKLRPLYAIRPGASGDISLKPGETNNEYIAWYNPVGGPYNPSPLFYEGRVYVLYDRGLVSCYDAKKGQVLYERERLPNGLAFTSSSWAAGGKVFCLNEDGVCYVLRTGDKFELLHTNKLADDDMCMATPALAGDRLLIRTAARLYCIRAKGLGGRETAADGALPNRQGWDMGPFIKQKQPVLSPSPDSRFQCPILGKEVRWEEQNVYNPAAVVRDGMVYLFYRADDKNPVLKWGRTCRIGMAYSDDGIHFTRHLTPVLYPDNDEWIKYEWEGGCEDLHIVEGEDGIYYMNYTTWSGSADTVSVATSRDLLHWTKYGPAFRKAGKIGGRSGVVISRLAGDRLIAAKINGKYWMYYTHPCALAWSDNLIDWTPAGKAVWPGGGREAGALALLHEAGILLMTQGGHNSLGAWVLRQALIDRNDLRTVLEEQKEPFLYPELDWEKKGFTGSTTVANTLVPFKGQWLLYYGAADHCIGLAVFSPKAKSPFSLAKTQAPTEPETKYNE